MFGVFGFWILGIMTYLLPRVMGASDWYRPRWNHWHFWLSGLGMLVMFVDLTIAGLIQGFAWRDLAPWETSLTASRPFWMLRAFMGTAIVIGQFFFFANIWMTWRHMRSPQAKPAPITPTGLGPIEPVTA